MADPKYNSANIVYQTDTFGAWVDRTNQIIFDLFTTVVTSQQNTAGGVTSGNVVITSNTYNYDTSTWTTTTGGQLQANLLIATTGVRGGNMTSSNTLLVVSNTDFIDGLINVSSNSSVNAIRTTGTYIDIKSNTAYLNSTSTIVNGALLDIDNSNTSINTDSYTLTSNNISLKANSILTVVDINSNGTVTDLTIAGETFTIDSDETTYNANVTIGASFSDTLTVVSAIDDNFIPISNTILLGNASNRWVMYGNTLNTSGDITVGADVDTTGETNTGTLVVRSTSELLGAVVSNVSITSGNVVIDRSSIRAGNSSVNASVSESGDVYASQTVNTAFLNVRTSVNSALVPTSNNTSFGNTVNRWNIFATSVDTGSINITGTANLQNVNINGGIFTNTTFYNSSNNSQSIFTIKDDQANVYVSTQIANNLNVTGDLDLNGNLTVSGGSSLTVNTSIVEYMTIQTSLNVTAANITLGDSSGDSVKINGTINADLSVANNVDFTLASNSYIEDTNNIPFVIKYANGSIAWPSQ